MLFSKLVALLLNSFSKFFYELISFKLLPFATKLYLLILSLFESKELINDFLIECKKYEENYFINKIYNI